MPNRRKRIGRPGYKARRTAYKTENRQEKNKLKKQEKHLKKHPNDVQITIEKVDYTRRKPLTQIELFVKKVNYKDKSR